MLFSNQPSTEKYWHGFNCHWKVDWSISRELLSILVDGRHSQRVYRLLSRAPSCSMWLFMRHRLVYRLQNLCTGLSIFGYEDPINVLFGEVWKCSGLAMCSVFSTFTLSPFCSRAPTQAFSLLEFIDIGANYRQVVCVQHVTGYVFSRRFSSEKCPTLTVASFFIISFFRQTTDLIAYLPLFTETDKTIQTTQAKSGQCKLSAKGPPFHF